MPKGAPIFFISYLLFSHVLEVWNLLASPDPQQERIDALDGY
jgi:hypothetical protein